MLRIAASMERRRSESESDGEEEELVNDLINLSNQSGGGDAALFPSAGTGSAVLGPAYSTGGATMAAFRESKIKEAENLMSSNDKKRLVRLLMESDYFCEDLKYTLTYSLPMRSLEELVSIINTKGMPSANTLFEQSQEKVRLAVETLGAKLRHELGLIYLANDKGNAHGFETIDKMKSWAAVEAVTSKETRDQWSKACASLDKTRNQRKRKGHGNRDANKRRRRNNNNNGNNRPALPKCAACGKAGHVAGDARCRAAPAPTT